MKGNITFTIIKPSAVEDGFSGAILEKICSAGFRIVSMKMIKMSLENARAFYFIHHERPFYDGLTQFMSSGPVVVAILEKENAVESFRELIGATDPAKAAEGTVRKLFGRSVEANAVHGSDSDENALIEAGFFFSLTERF